jgi:PTH1 family peptidyl-tRNA hydrolase
MNLQSAVALIIIKPTTFMNESGVAIKSVMEFFRIPADQVIVVHDELDIPFGTIRGSFGGSSAGHNGIKSIIEHAGEHFERIRVGIGPKTPKQIEGADFVLGKFSKDQLSKLDDLTDEVSAMITERVFTGKLALEDRRFILQ